MDPRSTSQAAANQAYLTGPVNIASPYTMGGQIAAQTQHQAMQTALSPWGKSWTNPTQVDEQSINAALAAWMEGLTPATHATQERVGVTPQYQAGQEAYGAAAAQWLQQNAPDVFQAKLNELRTKDRKSFNKSLMTIAALAGGGYLAGSAMAANGATMAGVGGASGAGATGAASLGGFGATGTGAAAAASGGAATGSSAVPSAVAGGGATTPAGGVLGGASMPSAMQAGVAVPTGGSGAMGVGTAGATGASAAGGGSFDFLDGIFGDGAGSAVGSAASGFWNNGGREMTLTGLGAWQSDRASDDYLEAAKYAADRADPFYAQRPQYQGMLKNLMTDPNSIQQTPAYQFRFDQGQNALERSLSAKGYLGSGNLMHDLQSYGQGMASQEYDNQFNRLSGLSGAGFGPGNAGEVYGSGANQSIAQNQQTWGNLGTIGRVLGDNMSGNRSPMFNNYR